MSVLDPHDHWREGAETEEGRGNGTEKDLPSPKNRLLVSDDGM